MFAQLQSEFTNSVAWKPDQLLKGLLLWTSLVTAPLVWLPLVRGLIEGQAYQWQFARGIGGRGTGGAYPLLLLAAAFVVTLLYLGWRGARQPFHWFLLLFHGVLAALVLYAAVAHPDQFFFEGATWHIRFSLVRVGPLLFTAALALAVSWVIRDLRSRRPRVAPPWIWTRSKRVRLALAIGIVPAQLILLRTWGPFGLGAMIGVALTVWQWFLITHRLLAPVTFQGRQELLH